MLVLRVTMLEGRTREQKRALIRRLSEAAAQHLGWPLEAIRVIIVEVSKDNWGSGGQSMAEREERA
ncbi:tautomerase family protein [Thermorudis peleae]|uniref:tautomerase family protein n=1 Tax=Thermorudis peleae TaxID=1382356 RepID=UPI0005700819|nr:2-hydroxymuconate tautomerase family protein [Thermorudis peleae]MBX6753825.1 2-hydroxymuconate tautomerase family protein [Thermorudis peleae]